MEINFKTKNIQQNKLASYSEKVATLVPPNINKIRKVA